MSRGPQPPGTFGAARQGSPEPEFSDRVVLRARLLLQRGYNAREIRGHLAAEGHDIPSETLRNWLDGTTRRSAGWPAHHRPNKTPVRN